MTRAVFVVDAVRTPIGRIGGGLAQVRPDDLAAAVIRALVDRVDGLDPATIDDVHLGNGNGAGEDNRNVGRMAALLAGLPTSVPGVTENRLCGSGLEAVAAAESRGRGGRRRALHRRWRRVDEPRPVGGGEAGARLRAHRPHDALHDARLAAGQPRHAPAVDRAPGRGCGDPGRAVRDQPGGPGRLRPAQPPAGGRGLAARALRRRGRARARGRPRPGRVRTGGHQPGRSGAPPPGVPSGRLRDRRQRVADERRRRGPAVGQRGRRRRGWATRPSPASWPGR